MFGGGNNNAASVVETSVKLGGDALMSDMQFFLILDQPVCLSLAHRVCFFFAFSAFLGCVASVFCRASLSSLLLRVPVAPLLVRRYVSRFETKSL